MASTSVVGTTTTVMVGITSASTTIETTSTNFAATTSSSSVTSSTSTSSVSQSSVGVVVPLYTYPTDSSWSTLILAKQTYPSVPIIAIINPNSGAGSSIDSNYVTGISDLKNPGIVVLGYVHTSYGSRDISQIETEMSEYQNWYGVDGIFFDEMSNLGSTLNYYSTLANYANSLGFTMTMGNPGTTVDSSLIGVFSNLCIYENSGMPSISSLDSYPSSGDGFSYIAYGVNSLPSLSAIQSTAAYVSYIYITDLGGSNPYNGLPTYFSNEVSNLSQ